MISRQQADVVDFLSHAESYGLAGDVEVIETHISRVFLVGDRAFKMKRAVSLPYVDFSTAELRRAACEKEVSFNRAGAPGLYLGVREIRRGLDGSLAFGGDGELADAVVEMARFDQSLLGDRMAVEGRLTPKVMQAIAGMIAGVHATAPVVHAGSGSGNVAAVLDINEAGFATSHLFDPAAVDDLTAKFRRRFSDFSARLDRREAAGKVRRCHGDLHLRNICVLEGGPRLFDCIEFNDQIATIDTLYDLAFLLMDLWHRGLGQFASLVANRYLDASDDEDGVVLLPYFMAMRAAVRAHVTATQIEEAEAVDQALADEARSYFALADSLLDPVDVRLIAIGGLSGSGKSTIAEALAPHIGAPPGARVIESDRLRKAMFGVEAETRLPAEAYRPGVSEKVYAELVDRTKSLLADGASVIVNAVYDRAPDREAIERAAGQGEIAFTGIWLDVDADVLRARVAARRGGPSDADLGVLEQQLSRPAGQMSWTAVDAGGEVDAIVEAIRDMTTGHRAA